MKDCFAVGRRNKQNIINHLELVGGWATVAEIATGTETCNLTSIYCHCNNLVLAEVLERDRIEINGRLTFVYRLNRH